MFTIIIDAEDEDAETLASRFDRSTKQTSLREIGNFIAAMNGGMRRGLIRAVVGTARASKAVNCDQSDAVDGTDALTIAGTALSVEAAPASEDEFEKGADDIEFADNLAAAINAHSVLKKLVYAVSDGVSDVTVYSKYPGTIGNLITLSEAGNGLTIAGGATALSGGTSDEIDEYTCGVVNPGV
jgi:hypothetical protein